MSMKKNYAMKAVSVAVLSALSGFAAAAVSGIDISASSVTPAPYAQELVASSSSPLTLVNGTNALDLVSKAGYTFGLSEVRYARFECSSTMQFVSPTITPSDANALTANGVNVSNNVLSFTVTANSSSSANVANSASVTLSVSGNRTVTSTDDVTCSFALYDTPSQALNGGETGRLNATYKTGKYIDFEKAQTTTFTSNTGTADVNASPAYTKFISGANTFNLATISVSDGSRFIANGANFSSNIALTGNQTITLAGDFSAAASANSTYDTAAKARVFLNAASNCTGSIVANAATLSGTTATFTVANTAYAANHFLCYTANGTTEIPAATYTGSTTVVAATGYAVTGESGKAAGEIKRNGSTMVAPLIQTPAGWISRLVLTNHGSTNSTYTVRAVSEAGVTTTLSGALSGTQSLPANKTVVIDLTTAFAATGGAPRGSLVVTANAPDTSVDGLYQIVNATSGTISNHVLSYKK